MSSSFADLGVPNDVVAALAARGITEAFPIQTDTIPPAIEGRDLCGKAPTGSGKTLAFGIPLALRVEKAKPFRPKALILAPTRELAHQIETALKPILEVRKRRIASFYGGVGFSPQRQALRKGCDVVVACPGRLLDLVRRSYITLDDVNIVVVDEADRMADMGFLPDVRQLLKMVCDNRQTLLFSATLDGAVDTLIRDFQNNPVRCAVSGEEKIDHTTTHKFVEIGREGRIDATASLVNEHGSTIVFCRTRRGSDRVATQLARAGVQAAVIHGGRSQQQRERALAQFQAGKITALVATDVAARGIHVDAVGCVVHFDLPADAKDYVHRSGRTGRAGAEGMVVSFVTEVDRSLARSLRKSLGLVDDKHGHAKPHQARPGSQPAQGRTAKPGEQRRRSNPRKNATRSARGGQARNSQTRGNGQERRTRRDGS